MLLLFCYFGIVFWSSVKCNPITNSHFNEEIREFSAKEDGFNSSNAKTLLKADPELYANFTPIRSPVKFQVSPTKATNIASNDLQDNAQSSSSYSRGLVHHDHPEYTVHEYDGPYDYGHDHPPGVYHHGIDHHGFDHHSVDHYGHHGHHDHYHDHHKYHHGLAAKTVLWPIAGLALLGAAAALVTNPILLQIGVATGKRRRRDTEEDMETNIDVNRWSADDNEGREESSENREEEREKSKTKMKQRLHLLQRRKGLSYRRKNKSISPTESTKSIDPYTYTYNPTTPGIDNDSLFIPVPIKIKDVS